MESPDSDSPGLVDPSAFSAEIEARNAEIMRGADQYDMSMSPHQGPSILARSDVDLPLVTDDARHGELHDTTSLGSDPPQAKPPAAAEGVRTQHHAQGGCCSVGRGLDMCPLFKNGGDLGGFERNGWKPMPCPMVIDSGAAETVIPTSWFTDHAIRETEASKSGVYYTTANGVKVYNKGEKTLTMCHFEGSQKRDMTFQVADVNKALGSANKIVRNGNRIVMDLDDEGHDYSYIESKSTGERLWLREREGVYVLDMLVAPAPAAVAPPDPGFTGRGR